MVGSWRKILGLVFVSCSLAVSLAAAGVPVRYCADALVHHEPRTSARQLWHLNRRLGRGWRDLHRRGGAPPWWPASPRGRRRG